MEQESSGSFSFRVFMCVAGDRECVECGSFIWAITSDYLQRGLKSCLAQFSSQTYSFIFPSRIGSMGIWVAARMWRMVTLMWLGAHVRVTSSKFHEKTVAFASPVLFTAPLNVLLLCSWSKRNVLHILATGAVVTWQQVVVWLCVSLPRRSRLGFVSCFRLAWRWPSEATGNKKYFEWKNPAGDQRFAGKNIDFLLKPSRFTGSDRRDLDIFLRTQTRKTTWS